MEKVMMTLQLSPDDASLDAASRQLGISPAEFDADFGVIGVSPKQHLYAVMVNQAAAERAKAGGASGPFANPKIEPFGPDA
jgi:hypothetical protein